MRLIKNLGTPNSKKIQRVIVTLKLVLGSLAGASYLADKPNWVFALLIGGGVTDIIITALDPGDNDTSKTNV